MTTNTAILSTYPIAAKYQSLHIRDRIDIILPNNDLWKNTPSSSHRRCADWINQTARPVCTISMNALIHAAQGAIFRLFLEVIAITNLFGEETLHGRNATSDDNIREPWKKCQRKGEFRDCMRLHYLRGIADKKLFIPTR